MINKKVPEKQRHLGRFIVPCSIGGVDVGYVLYDLRASINMMPISNLMKLGISEAMPTQVPLQLADRSITYPKEKIENVLVKVNKFIFSVDVIVLDYEADRVVPIIPRCPFLAIEKVLIDVNKGELTMHVDSQEVKFNVQNLLKFPDEGESCQFIESTQLLEEENKEVDRGYKVHALNEKAQGNLSCYD
ncbi:uncharacterized protein LOC120073657 [Benincasa hispida]|uniref:uncharacterized protein LOC120073657 n=1 Tax=Benincasa hispida TaxID=102211 RepID=UPI001901B576|nr:uncharacterized protein LOC120073657 [Benincasa hispida]